MFDLTTEGRNVIADTFLSFEIWMTVAAIYLVLTVTLSVFVSYLETPCPGARLTSAVCPCFTTTIESPRRTQ